VSWKIASFVLARKALVRFVLAAALTAASFSAGHAAQTEPTMQVLDDAALKPPAGARVAIVEFSDLQCPACARANPLLMQAVATYKIPWIRHDLLIPSHNWSRIAAVNARWFDSKSKALGEDYRNQLFANQNSIYNPMMLSQFTHQFAASHGVTLPFDLDPQGKFEQAVDADNELGKRTGIQLTPTIFIVTAGPHGNHYVQVTDQSKLFQMIDQALQDTRGPAAHASHK
jgi:protein-disulfide isomerase